jgi:type I restriction enzyme S subunit
MLPAGTVLMSSRAPIGYVAIALNPVCTSQGFKSFVLPDGIDPKYVFYFLKRGRPLVDSLARGTTFREISGANSATIPFPLPPLAEQRRVVAEIEKQFTRLDSAIESLNAIKHYLKRYRASTLKAAFKGNLVPPPADSALAAPDTAEVIVNQVLAERQDKWENDQLSRILSSDLPVRVNGKRRAKYKSPQGTPDPAFRFPDGWAAVTLGHIAWSVKDGPHFSPRYVESGVPFITGGNVRPEGVEFVGCRSISPEDYQKFSKRCKPERGDLLYTKGGTTGIARVNSYDIDFSVWVHVAVLKLIPSVDPFFLQHILNSPPCYAQAQKFTHGVGNQDLGLTRMVNITLGLPSLPEQKRVVAEVDRKLSVIGEIEAIVNLRIKSSARLRQAILAKAFSGQLVPQDPNDEPASVLLKRIRANRPDARKSTARRKRTAAQAELTLQS